MKIIRQPNFADDYTPERLVAIVLDETEADLIAKLLNRPGNHKPQDCFVAVADDYELKVYEVVGRMR